LPQPRAGFNAHRRALGLFAEGSTAYRLINKRLAKGHDVSAIRLVCPNCGARYDVPADVIPDAGRDVQCSNCGHMWFASRPEATIAPPQPTAAPRPPVSEEARDVFRQEREHETRRRARETALESQPDLGLDAPDAGSQARRAREARDRMARLRGENIPAAETPRPGAADSRGSLLPDVNEITQSLRGGSDLNGAPPQTARNDKGGFTRGFSLAVTLGGAALAAYVYAEELAVFMPGIADTFTAYTVFVDETRIWLDGQTAALLVLLDDLGAEASGGS
jgi:predicted Zn finger-like uncharacterized protein